MHRNLRSTTAPPAHLGPLLAALPAALLAALVAGGCAGSPAPGAAAPRRAAGPALAERPRVSSRPVTDAGYHNETSAATNPLDPANGMAAYQVPASVATTLDGGATWTARALPGTDSWQLAGDPAVLFDADGRGYALYIAFDRPDNYDTLGVAAHRNGILVNRSDDGGRSWRPEPTAVIHQPEQPGIPFEDKPMMAADGTDQAGRRGNVYVAWTEFRRHESVILFSRSTDGGRSFEVAQEISDRPGSPKDSVGADEGTDVAVGPDGTVYVVWSDSTGIRIDRSHDAGRTFGEDVLVARTPDIVFGIPGVARANGYPSLEVDPRSGMLYVEWVDRRLGAAAVFLTTSSDGGRTWTAPVTVSGNGPADRRDRFFSWMSLDPVTGLLVFGWYRSEEDGTLSYRIAWSDDGGATFRRDAWSAAPFPSAGEFLGDYTGVSAYGGVAYAAWTEALPGARVPGVHAVQHRTRVVAGVADFRRR